MSIQSILSGAARKALEMLVDEKKKNFLERLCDRHYERGLIQGKAQALIQLLALRGLAVSTVQRDRILTCTEPGVLDRWIASALSAGSVVELLLGEKRNFLERLYDHHYERGVAEGKAEGKAEAILQLLASRKLTLSDDQRQRITSCTQLETIDRWLTSVLSVASVDELLGPR